jgi:ABC-type multidrug transport system ATPase subunit
VRIAPGKAVAWNSRKAPPTYREYNFEVPKGQFWVIRGASGGGKSTLLKQLVGIRNASFEGEVWIESGGEKWNCREDPDRYSQLLGYVAQELFMHHQLTPRQVLQTAARMRGQRLSAEEVQNQLLRLGLDREQMRRPIGALSGGQERRVRTAAALVTNPGLLLLDEPDSGLDHRRQVELMRLLRMVSNRGCTILMVSHGHLSLLEHCDGVVYLRDTGDDDVVQELRRLCHRVEIVDPPRPAIVTAESNQDLNSPAPQTMSRRAPRTRIWKQVLVELKWQCLSLMKRELQLCLREPEWRLVTPLVIALIFALTVGLSAGVESLDQPLLGFLAVLSSLWMGASLSLLGITGERDVFDYERMVFLRIPPYVTAKALCFGVLSAIQTTVFVVVVFLLRHRLVAAEPAHPFSGGCLLGTGCILVLVGLLGVTL